MGRKINRTTLLAAGVAVWLGTAGCCAAADEVDSAATKSHHTARTISFEFGWTQSTIDDFQLDAKSSVAYVVGPRGMAINIWEVIAAAWPEFVTVIPAVIFVCVLWRALRLRRTPGSRHCRNCNYCLTGLRAAVCPECGAALSNRNVIIGKPIRARVIIASTLLVGILASYALVLRHQPRQGEFSHWFAWWSVKLHAWSEQGNAEWLAAFGRDVAQIAAVDVADGRKIRSLFMHRGSLHDLALSADGKMLLTRLIGLSGDSSSQRLLRISARSGGVISEVDLPRFDVVCGAQLIDCSADGAVAYLTDPEREALLALNASTGEILHRIALNFDRDQLGTGWVDPTVRFSPPDRRWVLISDRADAGKDSSSGSTNARTIWKYKAAELARVAQYNGSYAGGPICFAPDGEWAYIINPAGGIIRMDLLSPHEQPVALPGTERHPDVAPATTSPNGRWLFLVSRSQHQQAILAYDLVREQFDATMELDASKEVESCRVTPDGRHLVALVRAPDDESASRLVVFDLDQVLGGSETETPDGNAVATR